MVEVLAKYPSKIFTYTNRKYFVLIQAKDAIIRNDIIFITKECSKIKYVVDKVFFMYKINVGLKHRKGLELLGFLHSD